MDSVFRNTRIALLNIMDTICTFPITAIVAFATLVYMYRIGMPSKGLKVPTIRPTWFLPDCLNRLLFVFCAPELIHHGYKKYKDKPYRILKPDADLIVLPVKYLDEIRHLPDTKLSLLEAQFSNVMGEYINVLNGSHLPGDTVAKRLTPALNRVVPQVLDELEHAFRTEVPDCTDDWVSVNIYNMILKLINRATSRIVVGDKLCRNEHWLETVVSYTHNIGITLICLRPLPRFIRPWVAKVLPSVRALDRQLRWVKEEVFVPMIISRRDAEVNNPNWHNQKPDDFMQWMIDLADNPFDREPGNIAQGLMIIIALAVIHTSSMLITHGLFDLMTRPGYLGPLRDEIRQTLGDIGWKNATQAAFAKQRRLDSFLRESQRFNPTGEVSIHRITKETIIFSDGFVVPIGTHICFPAGPMAHDASIIDDPETFDGFRWCRDPEARNVSLVSISHSNPHFGYGRQACPGRFFAANTSKAILSRLLIEYDIKFEEGKEGVRPTNIRNGEQIMPNVWTNVLIKRRGERI